MTLSGGSAVSVDRSIFGATGRLSELSHKIHKSLSNVSSSASRETFGLFLSQIINLYSLIFLFYCKLRCRLTCKLHYRYACMLRCLGNRVRGYSSILV